MGYDFTVFTPIFELVDGKLVFMEGESHSYVYLSYNFWDFATICEEHVTDKECECKNKIKFWHGGDIRGYPVHKILEDINSKILYMFKKHDITPIEATWYGDKWGYGIDGDNKPLPQHTRLAILLYHMKRIYNSILSTAGITNKCFIGENEKILYAEKDDLPNEYKHLVEDGQILEIPVFPADESSDSDDY